MNYSKQFIDEEDKRAVLEVLESDYLTTGPKVKEFEEALCKYTGAKYALAVSSGTAALHISSLILLNKGDLVLTTPNSFVATANSILYANAIPIFVDIKEDGNINLNEAIKLLEKFPQIKALYAVHFSGNPVDMEKLKYIKERFNIKILEDSAHAIGSKYNGKWRMENGESRIGDCRYSDVAIFSFHPVKNITTAEGGAILTNDKEIYQKAVILRNHGIVKNNFINKNEAYDKKGNLNPWYYEMQDLGFNYRMSDIQASLGISQLKKLDKFIKKRQFLAKRYDKAFENSIIKPLYKFNENSSYHLYVVRVDFEKLNITKAEFFYKMREQNINLQLHYIPIYKQPYYQKLGYDTVRLPQTEKYYKEAFSIPLFYEMDEKTQGYVIESLFDIINKNKKV